MMTTCANPWCRSSFTTSPEDLAHLARFDIHTPFKTCPRCRHQHRALFKGSLNFFKRQSSLSGKDIVSLYANHQSFPVYSIDEWWSDAWDAEMYGRDYDPARPFFTQFEELHRVVPKIANYNHRIENGEYSAYAGNGKNAYYCDVAYSCQDVLYCDTVTGGCDTLCDCLRCYKNSSRLYECVQCENCHESIYLYLCKECRDCRFCVDCKGCSECIFCSNLRNKEYHIFNRAVPKEEYRSVKESLLDGCYTTHEQNLAKWKEVLSSAVYRALQYSNVERCSGDVLANSVDSCECYYSVNLRGCRYCLDVTPSKENIDSVDTTCAGIGELLFNCIGLGGGNYFMRMCVVTRECSHCTYCIDCYSCHDCFGCTGLRNKRYCVLNMQYSREEYETLVGKIVMRMKGEGLWGSFFPASISPFGYNDSLAINWFPLSEEEALTRGFRWTKLATPNPEASEDLPELPDSIDHVKDDICSRVLVCRATARKFKITAQELKFYRDLRVPLPRYHVDYRMAERRRLFNPLQSQSSNCRGCGQSISTSFDSETLKRICCDKCYLTQLQ